MASRHRAGRTGPGAGPAAAVVLLVIVLYAPLLYVVYASVNANPSGSSWQGATAAWFREAWNSVTARQAFENSVSLAVVSSVGATLTGTSVALAVRRTRTMRAIAVGLAGARTASPEIIIATGLAVLLPMVGVRFGFRPMAVGHIAYLSAYVALLVGARAAGADISQEEAALDLGAKRWQVLRDVVIPDVLPAVVAAGLLAAAFSFDDVALSQSLRGPTDTTLPVFLVSTINSPNQSPSIYAIGTMVIGVGAVVVGAAALVGRVLRAPAAHAQK